MRLSHPNRKADRIEQVERGIRELIPKFPCDYRLILGHARSVGIVPTNPLDFTMRIWDRFASYFPKRKVRNDYGFGSEQLLRRPAGIITKGGDCDDLNLVLLGGTIRETFGSQYCASLYLPNHIDPRHVVFLLRDPFGGPWAFDLSDPASRGPWDGHTGYRLDWDF